MAKKGLFITFEGGEGAGKTSLIDEIERHFRSLGREIVRIREPGGTWLGEDVRQILLDPAHKLAPHAELALFLASRAQQLHDVVLPALKAKKIVLCDRYNESSIAYQGVARGLGAEAVAKACDFFCGGQKPHLTLYLDIDPEEGLARAAKTRAKDRIEQEKIAFHRKIRSAYRKLAKASRGRICQIDASQSKEQVFATACKAIEKKLHV